MQLVWPWLQHAHVHAAMLGLYPQLSTRSTALTHPQHTAVLPAPRGPRPRSPLSV